MIVSTAPWLISSLIYQNGRLGLTEPGVRGLLRDVVRGGARTVGLGRRVHKGHAEHDGDHGGADAAGQVTIQSVYEGVHGHLLVGGFSVRCLDVSASSGGLSCF